MAVRAPRRGLKADFEPNKLVEGELAMPLDTKELYVAFSPGDVQKLATHENVKEMVEEATDEVIADFTEGVNSATEYATEQGDYAKEQGNHAKTQGSYAKEQGDYAKAQGQAAESIVLENIATETTPGIVRGGGDVKVDPVTGDMTAPDKLEKTGDTKDNIVTFEQATEDGELTSGSKLSILIGLIKKKFADMLTAIAGKIDKTSIAQTTEVNDSNKVPSTVVTNGMAKQISSLDNSVNTLNNNFASQDASALFVNGYSALTAPVTLSKSGKVVLLSMYLVTIGTDVIDTLIMILPPEYRPSTTRYCNIPVTNGGALDETPYTLRVTIWNDGSVYLAHTYTHKSTHPYIMGTLVFSI